jgi:hypothetical protein
MKKHLSVGLMMVGYAWCGAVLLLGIAYALVVWVQDDLGTMVRLFSPFNYRNWLTALVTFAPGILLIVAGDRLWTRANKP